MKYITGTYALNLSDGLTPGDWHYYALDWDNPTVFDTECSPFGEWGIYENTLPFDNQTHYVANHVRACLDLIAVGDFVAAGQMREHFIADDSLAPIIFQQVTKLTGSPHWSDIDRFLGKEYLCKWLDWKEAYTHGRENA